MWFWFFDLVDLWVIEIKTSVILCALGTSRSSEQNRKHRSRSENMPKISLLYSQHNKIVWLSNIEDTICEKFTRCAKFCGLFFSDADWLGRQTLITWKQWTGKVEKNSIETAWRRELMTDGPKAASSSNTKVEVYSGIFTKPSNSVNTQRYSPPLRSTVVVLVYTKPVNNQRQKMNFIWSNLGWKGGYSRARPLSFGNQWISWAWVTNQSVRKTLHWYVLSTVGIRDGGVCLKR